MKILIIATITILITACQTSGWREGEFLRLNTETMTVQERIAWNSSWLLGEEAHYNRDGSTLIDGIELRDGYLRDEWWALLDNNGIQITPHPTVSETQVTCHKATGLYSRACKIGDEYHVTAGDVVALTVLATE